MGDSIAEGYGMDPVEGVEHLPWAARVARALGAELHNLGRRNLRAAQVREQQLGPAIELRPDLVGVAAGCNDMLFEDFSRDQVERDLDPLFAGLVATGARVFTFTYMNLPGSGILPADGARILAARMDDLHAAVRALSERHGVLVVDVYGDPRSASPQFFSADLQHANARGQAYVAQVTLEALERAGWARRAAA